MASITRLPSGAYRVQIRRKGRYASETFLRRDDAHKWARQAETLVDQGLPPNRSSVARLHTFGDLVDLHIADMCAVGKPPRRSKAATLATLKGDLGKEKIGHLDRHKLIDYGRKRADQGAGPVTLGIDIGVIKMILTHAAAVHGLEISPEPVDLARVALKRLGLIGKGVERDRRPTTAELNRLFRCFDGNARLTLPMSRIVQFAVATAMRLIAIGAVGIAACTFAISGTATWVVPGYIGIQGMAVELAPVIGTLMGLSQVVFLIVGGYVADRMEKTAVIRIGILMALATALLFTGAMLWQMPFAVLVLLAGLSGIAVFGGGAVFALMSERYDVSLAPAAVGYAEVFGVLASFMAQWMMGAIIHGSGGSFWQAFAAFAVVEVLLLGVFAALVASLAKMPRPIAG